MQELYKDFNLKDEILSAHIRANFMNILSLEPYEIMIKPNFDTACWYYDYKNHTHKIFIGENIFDRIIEGFKDKSKIVQSYFIHEAAHSIFTTKNLVALNKKLSDKNLNFQLFNLFEDARIEYKIREIFGYSFNWSIFEEIPHDNENEKATTTLFKIIQTEDKIAFDVPYYEKVKNYYDNIVKAKNEDEIIDIMIKWEIDFPTDIEPENNKNMSQSSNDNSQEQNSSQSQNGLNSGNQNENKQESSDKNFNEDNDKESDLELASQLQADPDYASDFEEDAQVIVGNAKNALNELENELAQKQEMKHLTPVESGSEIIETSNSTEMFQDLSFDESKIFPEKLAKAEERLKRILQTIDIEAINSSSHDKKFNMKGVIQALSGSPNAKPYKKHIDDSYEETKKKVFILMDGSSSMSNLPQKNMLTFCMAANRLANKNLFEGWIGGSKISGKGIAISQAFSLPIKDGFITSFNCDAGAEGIGAAIIRHLDFIKTSDYVFVMTDGNIHDKDLKFLKYSHEEIYDKTIGIYMGKRKHANLPDMKQWFKMSIIEKNFEDVIEKVVELLDPNTKANLKIEEILYENNEEMQNIQEVLNLNRI